MPMSDAGALLLLLADIEDIVFRISALAVLQSTESDGVKETGET